MESNKALIDFGGVTPNLELQKPEQARQPRKRFIGRRAAAERAGKSGDSAATQENPGAIEGKLTQL